MLISHVDYLLCVDCGNDLQVINKVLQDDVIEHGLLSCVDCERKYAIINQVGLMFPSADFKAYLREHERLKIVDLGYECALPDDVMNKPKSKQAKAAENWEFQHKRVL